MADLHCQGNLDLSASVILTRIAVTCANILTSQRSRGRHRSSFTADANTLLPLESFIENPSRTFFVTKNVRLGKKATIILNILRSLNPLASFEALRHSHDEFISIVAQNWSGRLDLNQQPLPGIQNLKPKPLFSNPTTRRAARYRFFLTLRAK